MTRTLLVSAPLVAALMALGACSGAPQASMLNRAGDPVAAYERRVALVAITPDTIDAYAAPADTTGGSWTYRLGIEDVVQLYVVDAEELTMPGGGQAGYRIEADGAIQLPFLGRVPADGLTPEALRADITRRLREYMRNPQVDIRVTGFNARHVAVVGAVGRPNRQALTTTPLTVIDAVNAAGGFTAGADNSHVVLIRGGSEQVVDLDAFLSHGGPTPVLQDGDVLRVGEGSRSARAASRPEATPALTLTLPGAAPRRLALGGGRVTLAGLLASQAPVAATVYVLRPGATRVEALYLGSAEALAPALGGRLVLTAGDSVVVVPGTATDTADHLARINPALSAL